MKSDGPPRSPQSWEHLLEKDPNTATGFRIGLVAALFLHGVIFAVTWPTIAQAPPAEPEHDYIPVQLVDIRYPEPPPPVELDPPIVNEEGTIIVPGPPEEIPTEPVERELPPPPKGPDVVAIRIPDPPPELPDPPPTIIDSYALVDPPQVVHRVEPRYPDAALHVRKEGVVILGLVIDTGGRVESIKVLRGLPLGLTQSAVEAVQQWVFKPSTYKGHPVAVRYNLTIRFNLT